MRVAEKLDWKGLMPTGCMRQQVYKCRTGILPALYLFVLYLSQNKQ
jgi:hypothetical protein